mgnify:CR=1 FL=1
MSHLRFESNVNYDLGKTAIIKIARRQPFESNVNYDLGKTAVLGCGGGKSFESNVNYDLGKTMAILTDTETGLRAM